MAFVLCRSTSNPKVLSSASEIMEGSRCVLIDSLINLLGGFIEGLDAVSTDFYPSPASRSCFVLDLGPLEVWVALGSVGRIIMTSKELSSSDHDRFFAAIWTSGCHKFEIRISKFETNLKS